MLTLDRFSIVVTVSLAALLIVPVAARGQAGNPTFSIDTAGPTIGSPPAWSSGPVSFLYITGADILSSPIPGLPIGTPMPGPFATPPGISHTHAALGLIPDVRWELDALSYGHDALRIDLDPHVNIHFSVDRSAVGVSGLPTTPNVWTEGALGNQEASADVFINSSLPVPFLNPLPPPVSPYPTTLATGAGNTAQYDGNGVLPSGLPGYALGETIAGTPNRSDNLDAVDVDTTPADLNGRIYFSLDTASALNHGFVGGDVLVTTPTGPAVFVSAQALGLDVGGRTGSDDLDALAMWDDNDQWDPGDDPILFSVRQGSAIIGTPDSIFGMPIEPGDVLTDPAMAAKIMARANRTSPNPGLPGIIISAEQLGLVTTRFNQEPGDDLNALDVTPIPEPTTMALLAVGGVLALVRRRRKA